MTYEEVWTAIEKFALEHGMFGVDIACHNDFGVMGLNNKNKNWTKRNKSHLLSGK